MFKTLLANKDEIAADVAFSICIEHHGKARRRDLGFIRAECSSLRKKCPYS